MQLIFEEQNKWQKLFELDEMILLSKLFFERNLKINELSDIIQKNAYVRQQGFSNIQREEMIKNFVLTYEKITRADVIELCRVTKDQAYIILSSMVKNGILKKIGEGKGTFYTLND